MSIRLSVKSKLGAEFRRFSLKKTLKFNEFKAKLEKVHNLFEVPFFVFYTDPNHGDLLPINNDDNFSRAISLEQPCLKLILQTKGECWIQNDGFGKKKNFFDNINNLLPTSAPDRNRKPLISYPEDFRQVSSIIDVDVVPETCRRVRLVKHGSDKPLGFYIRDGTSVRVTSKGLEKVPGIFISRLVPGGLAESTGLLAVSDEVLEVNGIEVLGKNLDQVTEMMVANSSNLIITIRPAGQRIPFQYPTKKLLQDQQLEMEQKRYHSSDISEDNIFLECKQILDGKKKSDRIKNDNLDEFLKIINQKYIPNLDVLNAEKRLIESALLYDVDESSEDKKQLNNTAKKVLVKIEDKDDDDDEDEVKEHMNL